MSVTYPPESFQRNKLTGAVSPITSIRTNPDGTMKRAGVPASYMTHSGALAVVDPEAHLDATAVMQIALYRILSPMVMHRRCLEAVASGSGGESSSFRWTRVIFDMPRIGEQDGPFPAVSILPSSPCRYEYEGFDTKLDESTIDVFGAGTVIRKHCVAKQQFQMHCVSAHHEERRGIKAAFERGWTAEPDDDESGRKIVVPEYYRRTVRVEMEESDYTETQPLDFANKHELVVMCEAEVPVVTLVRRPADISTPHHSVEVCPPGSDL